VIGLLVLSGIGFAARIGPALPVAGIVLGLIVVWLGLNQTTLLVGSAHWIIQVLHLLAGLAAIGMAENLGRRIKGAGAPATA
jgi:hypothetical protein